MTNLEGSQGNTLEIGESIKHGYIIRVNQTTVHEPPATDIWRFHGEVVGKANN